MRYIISALILLIGFTTCFAAGVSKTFDYGKAWSEIDKLSETMMPKSALEKLDAVYQAAVKEGNTEQQIKSLVYQMSMQFEVMEESDGKVFAMMQQNIKQSSFPVSAILHSMLGEMYWNYYQNNYYQTSNRTETENFTQDDIGTWDIKRIAKASLSEYQTSLKQAEQLQKIMIGDYKILIDKGGQPGIDLRPTLYDLLAHRALEHYLEGKNGISVLFDKYKLTDAKLFAPAESFATLQIAPGDSLSGKYLSLKLYQDLIRFHLKDEDPAALVVVDLDRLGFVLNNFTQSAGNVLYENALIEGEQKYRKLDVSTQYTFKRALLYQSNPKYINPDLRNNAQENNYKRALNMCDGAIEAFPNSLGSTFCRELRQVILDKELSISMENVVLPGKPIKLMLSAKNITKVYLRAYKIPVLHKTYKWDDYDVYRWDNGERISKLLATKPVVSGQYSFKDEGDYTTHSFEVGMNSLPVGRYLVIVSDDFSKDIHDQHLKVVDFTSSNLSVLSPNRNTMNLKVCNRLTGKSISGATVYSVRNENIKNTEYQKNIITWTGKTDEEGMVTLPNETSARSETVVIRQGTDSLNVSGLWRHYGYGGNGQTKQSKCILFTDRSIYRPGQTIYTKGIIYETDGEKYHKLMPERYVELALYNTNGQVVDTQKLTANEFGSVNCSFTAPKGVLTGQMSIRATGGGNYLGYINFQVEEYKRPKFEVKMDPPKDTYKLGQRVTVTGKALAFAGFPIDGAGVKYTVKRVPRFAWWCWWQAYPMGTNEEIIDQGSLETDSKGEFSISFLAEKDDDYIQFKEVFFSFEISATATDINGESHTGTIRINVGDSELILDPVVNKYVKQSTRTLAIPVKTTNLNGEKVAAKGNLTISLLIPPAHIQKSRNGSIAAGDETVDIAPDRNYLSREEFLKLFPNDIYGTENQINTWKVDKKLYSGSFNTDTKDTLLINSFRKWKAGVYKLEATSNYHGVDITVTRYFTIYSPKSKVMPYAMADWFVPVKTTCEPGQTAEILIGSSYTDVSVLFEVEKNHKIVDSRQVVINNEQRLFRIPVLEGDRGSFYVHVTYTRDNRFYSHAQEISVSWKNKQLAVEYMTFRDKLLPGQKEEWRLKLKDYTGGAATAEVLASMYDASLDALYGHKWNANLYNRIGMSCGWHAILATELKSGWGYYSPYYPNYPEFRFSSLNNFGKYIQWNRGYGRNYRPGLAMESVSMSLSGASGGGGKGAGKSKEMMLDKASPQREDSIATEQFEPEADLSGLSARKNFAETAFFYPELRTDEKGEVSIAFTIPEALTKWKFQALALTKELQVGLSENFTVTQKPLMVTPNLPRFFREGDKITVSSKISALDEKDQSGQCQLFLFDAISLQPVDKELGLTNAQQAFSIKKGESTVVEWTLAIPFGISAVTCKVVAQAGNFSDGEENTIPVLTNRMLVTESLPLPVHGNSSKNFVFEKLKQSGNSTTLKNHKLTLEYTSNPAWYAVQALPYMMEYPHQCNEQIFTRFYANSLAGHIANSNPRIQRVFDAWKNSPNPSALLSNLEKNQELKSVILQETPWVLDARNESQSKQRIGLLFDLNNMKDQSQGSLLRLKQNQLPNGAWPWFTGMQDSWWVTQYIVEGLAHLKHLGVKQELPAVQKQMTEQAILYLDSKILEDYNNILKWGHKENDHLGYMEMHYIYTRSYFQDIEMNDKVSEALSYFRGQATKYWANKGLYGQALLALGEFRYGNKTLPNLIMASMKERAISSEELGMYWKENSSSWYWYQAPIETQALLIEAFNEIKKDTASVDDQRTWLLKQKQTTNWKTTKATAEACYALLLDGTEWLNSDKLATIKVDNKVVNPTTLDNTDVEAGTGYFKTSWSGAEITPQMANISVTNPNPVSSWGAMYWQYFEDLDKITSAETPLKLKKQLFLEKTTDQGALLSPIADKAQLKVGDKVVVRIELRTDRDMEYVHMKDMRSAGFEPINVLSRYKWQDGLGYYEATGDAATNFFVEYLRKGTYVFEYPLRVNNKGDFSNGITSIQCMYAPEFTSHSEGIRVEVK